MSSSPGQQQDMQFGSDQPIREPSGLSSLTALDHLFIGVKSAEGHLRLNWVTHLTSLQMLCIRVKVRPIDIPSDLTVSTNLVFFLFR